jgi:hypothetical protein
VESLKNVSYLNEIVISLDRASALVFRLAKQFFSVLPQRVRLIWNDGWWLDPNPVRSMIYITGNGARPCPI